MAKFNCGHVGGVSYKVSPTGFRKYLWSYKIIPYFVGYDVNVTLTIIQGGANATWNRGVLGIRPLEACSPNQPFSLCYRNGKMGSGSI